MQMGASLQGFECHRGKNKITSKISARMLNSDTIGLNIQTNIISFNPESFRNTVWSKYIVWLSLVLEGHKYIYIYVCKCVYRFLFASLGDHNWPYFWCWRLPFQHRVNTTGRISTVGGACASKMAFILSYEFPVWYIGVFSSLEVMTVISNILVMCIWLKPDIRSHVTIILAVLSLSDSFTVSFCHLFSIVTSSR
jgi:hypothetical protein